jgi:hypothetical protein
MRNAKFSLAAAAALLLALLSVSSAVQRQPGAVNRLVTPNGDGYNDTFVFNCYNPRDSAVDAKIYDLSGRVIATMQLKISGGTDFIYVYEWDPNSGGHWPGGVYLYRIRVEQKVYKGTVVVIR